MTDLDKFRFFEDLGYTPYDAQREIHECTAPRRVLAWGVRAGKTTSVAWEAVFASMLPSERPSRGWIVAPDYTLADKAFREIVLTFHTKLPHKIIRYSEHEKVLVVRNMGGQPSEVRAKTGENPTALLGEALDWCIVDEAARLKPDIWERYLAARLIDKKGWALLISTPKGKGWFYDLWRLGQNGNDPRWRSWQLPSSRNPHLDQAEIDAVRSRIPEAVFRQEFLAEFIEGAGQVFRNVRDLATGELGKPEGDCVAGLDLAKTQDYTVLVVLDARLRVVHVDRFHRVDWSIQVQRVREASERHGGCSVLVDSTGAGEPVLESLLAGDVPAVGYHLSNRSKNDLINNLALALERREITLPRPDLCPELVDELESFQYSVTDSGNVKTEAPPGYHDDCVIALALAVWQATRRHILLDEVA